MCFGLARGRVGKRPANMTSRTSPLVSTEEQLLRHTFGANHKLTPDTHNPTSVSPEADSNSKCLVKLQGTGSL